MWFALSMVKTLSYLVVVETYHTPTCHKYHLVERLVIFISLLSLLDKLYSVKRVVQHELKVNINSCKVVFRQGFISQIQQSELLAEVQTRFVILGCGSHLKTKYLDLKLKKEKQKRNF